MKTHINYEKMDTINHLQDAITTLNKANWVYINIPSDFTHSSELQNELSMLKDITTDLMKVMDWLRISKNDYQRLETELNFNLAHVSHTDIKSYNSKINE